MIKAQQTSPPSLNLSSLGNQFCLPVTSSSLGGPLPAAEGEAAIRKASLLGWGPASQLGVQGGAGGVAWFLESPSRASALLRHLEGER